jgi:hypothetical protein
MPATMNDAQLLCGATALAAEAPRFCITPGTRSSGLGRRLALWAVIAVLGTPAASWAAQPADAPDATMPLWADTSTAQDMPAPAPHIKTKLKTTASLMFRQTFVQRGNFESFMLQLEAEHERKHWGLYAMPRLRVTDFQKIFAGSVLMLHQAYLFGKLPVGQIKLGKVMSAFGRTWDYGMFGPLVTNNDVKMIPDVGLSLEAKHTIAGPWKVDYTLQYAPIDGRAVSIGHGSFVRVHTRRQHIATARLAPIWQPAPHTQVSLGLSAQRYNAVQVGYAQVLRGAADIEGAWRALSAFAELGHQRGDDRVVQKDMLVHSHTYVWSGVQWAAGPVSVRYHYNYVRYHDAARTTEQLHQPGVGYTSPKQHLQVAAELVFWASSPVLPDRGDKVLNIIMGGNF